MTQSGSNEGSFLNRLIVFTLLGVAIFSTIYAAQKVTTVPKSVPNKAISDPILTPTPSQASDTEGEMVASDRCIITLMDKRYDITDFREEHEGGNIFVCGTDMTKEYTKQHGNDAERPALFEIDASGNFIVGR